MTYYVVQVQAKKEKSFIRIAEKSLNDHHINLLWPRKKMRIRRRGKWQESLSAIFSGYVFIQVEEVSPQIYRCLKRIPGFIRFLKNNHDISPLMDKDKEIVIHFLKFGEIVGMSYAKFEKNKKIRILSGPLKGLEGYIVKVNKRKKRIKVKLPLYNNSFLIDFGFKAIEDTDEYEKGNEQNKFKK